MKRPPYGFSSPVKYLRCRDGDTVVVSLSGSNRRWAIRLLDCWCPESHKPGGTEATLYAEKLLSECSELSLFVPRPDNVFELLKSLFSFDRLLGHLFISKDQTLSEAMVEAGHATKEKPKK